MTRKPKTIYAHKGRQIIRDDPFDAAPVIIRITKRVPPARRNPEGWHREDAMKIAQALCWSLPAETFRLLTEELARLNDQ